MGRIIVWMVIMIPVSCLFTGLGIYAIKQKEPMWFWSGTSVSPEEITDIPAYNRANGIMWIAFSAILWISTVLGILDMKITGIFLIAGTVGGGLCLPFAYRKIYDRYRV